MVFEWIDGLRIGRHHKDTFRKLSGLIRLCGGTCDWPVRRIASYCDMPVETYKQHQRVLKGVGAINVEHRRIAGCRQNITNILTLGGGGVKQNTQKSTELTTNTKTPCETPPPPAPEPPAATPVKPAAPSKARLEWEAQREFDRECTRRMLHDREVRRDHDHECTRRRLGVYEGNALRWGRYRDRRCRVAAPDPMVGAGVRPDGFYSAQPHESDADREYREKYQRIQNERKVNTK